MTAKRFFLAALLLYALVSLFSPRSTPVERVETSALLFTRPFERLFSFVQDSFLGAPAGTGKALDRRLPPGLPGGGGRLWWKKVFDFDVGIGNRIALGGRRRSPVRPGMTRCDVDFGSGAPVHRGDPVVHGSVLLGFVDEPDGTGAATVLFLNDRDVRVVAAEAVEGIAGEGVFFIAGGRVPDDEDGRGRGEGEILIQCPSSRFGLLEGSRVVTSAAYNRADVPPGFLLGTVRAESASPRGRRRGPAIVPALDPAGPARMAVLVPRDRPGAAGRPPLPETRFETVGVRTAFPPGSITGQTFLRLSSGGESGIVGGSLVVTGGYCAARVTDVGFFSSRADPILLPGRAVTLTLLLEEGAMPLQFDVVRRKGAACVLKRGARLPGEGAGAGALEPGRALYLSGDPCPGSEIHPVCRVVERGRGDLLTVRCSDAGGRSSCLCPIVSS